MFADSILDNFVNISRSGDRRVILKRVSDSLKDHGNCDDLDINPKQFSRLFGAVLYEYSDSGTFKLLKEVLRLILVQKTCPQFGHDFMHVISKVTDKLRGTIVTQSSTKPILIMLKWLRMLVKYNWTDIVNDENYVGAILTCQSILVSKLILSNHQRFAKKAVRTLSITWNQQPVLADQFLSKNKDSLDVLDVLFCANYVAEFQNDVISKHKEWLITSISQLTINSKIKPDPVLLQGLNPFFKTIKKQEFESQLLPLIEKAILRNPEIMMQSLAFLIDAINLDFSCYSTKLTPLIIKNLNSNDEWLRINTVLCLSNLYKKCQSCDNLKSIVKLVFDIFYGSDGKLTVVEHKINVLKVVSNISSNSIVQNEQFITYITEYFLKVLNSEVNEKVLTFVLEMITVWCQNTQFLPKTLASKILDFVRNTKTSITVRAECLQVLKLTKKYDKSLTIYNFSKDDLKQFIEKEAFHLNQFVEIFNMLHLYLQVEERSRVPYVLTKVHKMVSDEKILSALSNNVLLALLDVCLNLSLDPFDEINVIQRPIIWAILYALVLRQNQQLCKNYFENVLILNNTRNGIKTARLLVFELNLFITKFNIVDNKSEKVWKIIYELVSKLAQLKNYNTKDKELFLVNSFLICNHNKLPENFWMRLLTYFAIDKKNFLKNYGEPLMEMLPMGYEIFEQAFVPILHNCICSLAKLSDSHDFLEKKILNTTSDLQTPSMFYSTNDQYAIYLTSDDDIYDKRVLEEIKKVDKETFEVRNMKRESKVYSYKEQLEELQIKREIEEKKRLLAAEKPDLSEIKLSAKQQEMLNEHKTKERAIRSRMTEIRKKLIRILATFDGLIKADRVFVAIQLKAILFPILNNLQSPLIAEDLVSFLHRLSQVSFCEPKWHSFGTMIVYGILRIKIPACSLPNRDQWLDIHLDLFCSSILETVSANLESFTVPMFTFMFPIIDYCVKSVNDELTLNALKIISHFAKTKPFSNLEDDLWYSKHLPKYEMYETLLKAINNSSNAFNQSQAINCVLELVKNCNGQPDTVPITDFELDFLLNQLQSDNFMVRDTIFRALIELNPMQIQRPKDLKIKLSKWTLIGCNDIVEEVSLLANQFRSMSQLVFPPDKYHMLFDDVLYGCECIQKAASKCLLYLVSNVGDSSKVKMETILNKLMAFYKEKSIPIAAIKDDFDHVIEPEHDLWQPRLGVAICLEVLSNVVKSEADIGKLIKFYIKTAFNDRNESVRHMLLMAALKLIDEHGKDSINTLLPQFEKFMDTAPKTVEFDVVREAVIVLMGNLAKHLDKNDARIKPIIEKLIAALSTPSETVQESVSECLHPLISSIQEEVPNLVQKLLLQLIKGDKYGERRGAAYGLAGIVKGMGIMSLKQFNIMSRLKSAIQDKKNYKQREGALFAFEILSKTLGRLFEPYVVHILPHLLTCFGDTSSHIRTAADDTARVVMSKLSAHGVKLVLPSLLQALNEDSWRTKTASIELLGSMAYCAPKQLSSCLPSIVPKLMEVLTDSHDKVQNAAVTALKMIGSVIRNPEIQAVVPALLQALEEPDMKTATSLQILLATKFIHFIDAPSLALIMPVVERAFKERSSETRKMSAQIIGNMYALTDQKDFAPYLPNILPGLKDSLLDAAPEVRTVSARALGVIVRGMGEDHFSELLPWLMQTLTTDASSVDRSGAAQGLAEVVGGLGVGKLNTLMPEIIHTAERSDIAAHVKDGYIMLFIYLPIVFGNDFVPYIQQIITPILKALADESEYVRDTALQAGQRIVNQYADTCISLFLPELERGLFDDNWRIRYSSVQLLGDLLFRISGVSGKMTTVTVNDDDNFGTEQSHHAIIRILGIERRNKVLAGLYMGRSDLALMVRQSALHVWKVVVTNTPKTLREILPTLFHLLLGCLASQSYDKRQVAARTLGDIVRKHGERVLPEIIPILEKGLESDDPDQRQGVCVGLTEIMSASSRAMVLNYSDSLIPTIQRALIDPLPEVRQAAAKTFDSLHSTVGVKTLDDILPVLIDKLTESDENDAEYALDGLRQIISVKSRIILPYLLPHLTKPPVNTKALAIIATASGEALNRYLNKILPALLDAISTLDKNHDQEFLQEMEHCQALVLTVSDDVGVNTLMDVLCDYTRIDDLSKKRTAITLICVYCTNTKTSYIKYVPTLIRLVIRLFIQEDSILLQAAYDTLNAIVKSLEPKQRMYYVTDVREAVRFALPDIKQVHGEKLMPGLCLTKGLKPLLVIFREAILNSSSEEDKIHAIKGLNDVIRLTEPRALLESFSEIAGPFIRSLTERLGSEIRLGMLDTLEIIMKKVGMSLRPFTPQLKSTCFRSIIDSDRAIRLKGTELFWMFVRLNARPDPIFTELFDMIRDNDNIAYKDTSMLALRKCIAPLGDKISENNKTQMLNYFLDLISHVDTILRIRSAGCLGALLKWLPRDQLQSTLNDHILHSNFIKNPEISQGNIATLTVAFRESPESIWTDEFKQSVENLLTAGLSSRKSEVTLSTVCCCAYLLKYLLINDQMVPKGLFSAFFKVMNSSDNKAKTQIAVICTSLAKSVPLTKYPDSLLKSLLLALMNGSKETNLLVRSNSEIALVCVLQLLKDDEAIQRCLAVLELGARESLNDIINKVLKKVVVEHYEDNVKDFDETLAT